MKIIQSFWSAPMLESSENVLNNRFCGGWLKPELHLLSWAYSCLQLRKFYGEVELVTDAVGKRLLVDELKLPYTSVDVELEKLGNFNPELWALGKLYAFRKQQRPFLHVDGDVFIWELFSKRLTSAPLIAQNEECNFSFYRQLLTQLVELKGYLPLAIRENLERNKEINAYNAGIIGGNDVRFFHFYVEEALKFIEYNQDILAELPMGQLNAFYEQHLFYCLAKQRGSKVACYTETKDKQQINYQFKHIENFLNAPASGSYIHLFGEDAKKNLAISSELERRMQLHYPAHYERAMQLIEAGL